MDSRAAAARRRLLQLATAVYVLILVIAVTGGGVVMLGSTRLSVRGVKNPVTLLALAVVAAAALAPSGRRWRTVAAEWATLVRPLEQAVSRLLAGRERLAATMAAVALALWVVLLGLFTGVRAVGGSDSYGYVSQARLWTTGLPRVEHPVLRDRPAGLPPDVFVPLAYRVSTDGTSLVPIYAPGLPLTMALFEIIGGPEAVYYVVPLLTGVAVLATYALGAGLAGPAAGVTAAALMAASPAILFFLTRAPMSDIACAAWWALSLALGLGRSRTGALLSGLAAGAAIVTRPNVVQLTVIAALVPLWRAREQGRSIGQMAQVLAAFAIGPVAASLFIAWLNWLLYGDPTSSGYGNFVGSAFQLGYFRENLGRYPIWIMETQPGALALAVVGAIALGRRRSGLAGVLGLFAFGNWLSYAFFLPLPDWWTLRFLFPAFPILFAVAATGATVLPGTPATRVATAALVVALGLAAARDHGAFNSKPDERFATIGRYVAAHLPPNATLLTRLHSGSANFYSGRMTVRWDLVPPDQLDLLVADLRRRGYVPYILLDDFEEPMFTGQFKGASRLAALDWKPVAEEPHVRLFAATPETGIE